MIQRFSDIELALPVTTSVHPVTIDNLLCGVKEDRDQQSEELLPEDKDSPSSLVSVIEGNKRRSPSQAIHLNRQGPGNTAKWTSNKD